MHTVIHKRSVVSCSNDIGRSSLSGTLGFCVEKLICLDVGISLVASKERVSVVLY
jgi:hypothetical protein